MRLGSLRVPEYRTASSTLNWRALTTAASFSALFWASPLSQSLPKASPLFAQPKFDHYFLVEVTSHGNHCLLIAHQAGPDRLPANGHLYQPEMPGRIGDSSGCGQSINHHSHLSQAGSRLFINDRSLHGLGEYRLLAIPQLQRKQESGRKKSVS